MTMAPTAAIAMSAPENVAHPGIGTARANTTGMVTVHYHDFLYGYPELARPLFRRIHQDFGLMPSTS